MQKIACVFSYKMSSWVSCQKIVFNLLKSYQQNADLELLKFNYSVQQTRGEIQETAKNICSSRPDTIVILDHRPHPLSLIQFLAQLYALEKVKPRIIVHVFGDFTLYYDFWGRTAKTLKDWPVEFIVASDRQKILMDKFLEPPLSSFVCPFPVDHKEFSFQPTLRERQRKQWGLSKKDTAFVYTGRLTRQKRTLSLIKTFSETLRLTGSENAHLFIYGTTDNIGDPFVGIWETEGEYFRKIFRHYRSFPQHIQDRIHFMGSVPNAELKGVYHGADVLVNLSVHNDEDYGMSVAEAQACGLPAILTDWGGLAGFEHEELPGATTYIPVKIGKRGKLISLPHVVKAMIRVIKEGHFEEREKLSRLALDKVGVLAGAEKVAAVLARKTAPFEGFSDFFEKVQLNYRFHQSTAYFDNRKNLKPIYREIYGAYVRNH